MKSSKYWLLFIVFQPIIISSQNIFPQKVEGCTIEQFCLDCGEPRANYETVSFEKMILTLNKKYNFKSKIKLRGLIQNKRGFTN